MNMNKIVATMVLVILLSCSALGAPVLDEVKFPEWGKEEPVPPMLTLETAPKPKEETNLPRHIATKHNTLSTPQWWWPFVYFFFIFSLESEDEEE